VSIGSTALVYGSGGYTAVKYSVEGHDASRFYDGNATLSFWVRSSIAGTYSILVANNWWGTGSADRGLVVEYDINQANTWERKSVTIDFASGTSAGTWGTTNSYGVLLQWFLGANANRIGDTYLNSWANWSAYEVMSSSATNWGTNANATFYLTGVQLEFGDKATPFEHRSFGEELALCQRYYQVVVNGNNQEISNFNYYNTTIVAGLFTLPVEMRSTPTLIVAAGAYYTAYANSGGVTLSSLTQQKSTPNRMGFYNLSGSGVGGHAGTIRTTNESAKIELSAEL